jgi:hypothetical protein
MNQREEIIFEFPKSQTLKIIGKIVKAKGGAYFDTRIYYIYIEANEWRPTPKGFRIPLDQIEELKEGVEKAFRFWWESLPGESGQ